MIITVDKSSLLESINTADSVISSKNINTLISNCLFNIKKEKIEIIGTDNDVAVRTRSDAISDGEGSFLVNGKKFASILKELPDDELTVAVDENFLIEIRTKSKAVKGHYKLIGASSEGFPEIEKFNDKKAVKIEQLLLKDLIKKVIYAASNDTIKPVFNGIYIVSEEGKLSSVATDSKRLAVLFKNISEEIDLGDGIIIPLKTINEIYRLLDVSGQCGFLYNRNQCFFKIGETEVISRITDGKFPNYKQVIPTDFIIKAKIERKHLIESARRAMIFTREPVNKVILEIRNDKLTIKANTPELGEAEEEIPVISDKKESITIGLNVLFLIDSLKEMDSDYVEMCISGAMNPLCIKPDGIDNYISVIMPMQVNTGIGE